MSRPQFKKSERGDPQKIIAHAQENQACPDCAAAPGEPCTSPGSGRTVHKSRYVNAAISLRRQYRATQRTPEQDAELAATLASLPPVPKQEIEACRTSTGGYRFTKAKLAAWGIPWPPPPGWRRAIERDEDSSSEDANPARTAS